jgi:hypothetical protein
MTSAKVAYAVVSPIEFSGTEGRIRRARVSAASPSPTESVTDATHVAFFGRDRRAGGRDFPSLAAASTTTLPGAVIPNCKPL